MFFVCHYTVAEKSFSDTLKILPNFRYYHEIFVEKKSAINPLKKFLTGLKFDMVGLQ